MVLFRVAVIGVVLAFGLPWCAAEPSVASPNERSSLEAAMRRATAFMVERVSCEGGYVWAYLPDLSRRWGELEATATMIWIQPPGTPEMGAVFLDAFEATGDDDYYRAAAAVGRVLMRVQHASGGWNYCADLAGEDALRHWYATVGANAWRLEEFQHYYGNATFDDRVTSSAASFLLRLYLARRDPEFRAGVERAIRFVLDAQYPIGAWPQRFPLMSGFSKDGRPDYTGYCTFNDDVAAGNIQFLGRCAAVFDDRSLLDAARRGMDAFVVARQPAPQAGWALQYTPDLKPAGARSYEPEALATHATAENIRQLFGFFRRTGDAHYLAPIPEALDWLERVALPEELRQKTGRTHPTFLELGTDRPLFLHRSGSNVANGRYFADGKPSHTVGHYASFRAVDVAGLRRELHALQRGDPVETADDEEPAPAAGHGLQARAARVASELNQAGYWPAALPRLSHPYRGPAPRAVTPGDYGSTEVGDAWDTSPFSADQLVEGITTSQYATNMRVLIARLRQLQSREH